MSHRRNEEVRADMKWTDEKIHEWARGQFGPGSALKIALRMNKEMTELLVALENERYEEALEELADLRIFMAQVNYIVGYFARDIRTIDERVEEKMEINEKREWEIGPDGSHQHVEKS